MLSLTLSRIKKAIKNPLGAIRYLLYYLKGEILRLRLKGKFLVISPSFSLDTLVRGKFFIEDKEFLEEIISQDFIISNAERLVNNEFGFLGIKPRILEEVEWHKDIKSGHFWEGKFYLDLKENLLSDYNKGWDIKNVWELSRFHYLIPLALAFYKTKEEKHLLKWQNLISDWIDKNPVYYGPNWLIAMEVAIRACNWIFSFEIINAKLETCNSKLEEEFLKKFFQSLFEHGRFIYDNLEYAPIRSNHYLSDIVGLIYLGIFFKNLKAGKKWLNFGIKALQKEILYQVYEDGVDYEMAISYHRYKTELFLWAYWLLKLNGIELKKEFKDRLLKMVYFVQSYTKPNGLAPQIGDSDDSRLHLVWEDFYNWERRNHFAVLKLAEYIFKEEIKKENDQFALLEFPKGGIYIVKNTGFYFITGRNKGCYGKGGSHQHNDILSFELNINSEDLIIDAGTFVYSPDILERNRFRSTKKHNVCLIDNQEENPITEDIFYYLDRNQLKIVEIKKEKESIALKGIIGALERTFYINFLAKSLIITDKILKESANLEWNFHLAPEIKVWLKKEGKNNKKEIILLGENGKYLFEAPKELNFAIIEDEVSPSYGVKTPSKTLQFKETLLKGSQKEFEFKIKPI